MDQSRIARLCAAGGTLAFIAACSPPPPEPPMLSPTPSFNKMGQLESCGQGYMVDRQRCVPDDRPGDD